MVNDEVFPESFEISHNMHQFKASSTAFIAFVFLLMLAYSAIKVISQIQKERKQEQKKIFTCFIRVIEQDLAPTLLILFISMTLGAFFAFLAVLSIVILAMGGVLTFCYFRDSYRAIPIIRIVIVFLTYLVFINAFVDNYTFFEDVETIGNHTMLI
eukprot:CAMPEP_0170553716 /NCGR_PEP_ID=MMETSP0211-20121228/11550_1 /TAXON_ID=311385 /ORGANISM="Pseudokeronopsis sp., Strain OXSARD2" /LENGTH=155 /DNA_ID=CAMNT_0010862243 /DNA_START=82 /DNA_END=549 /DNA_ORIENTATION=+